MRKLHETLAQVSLRAYRRWRVIGDASGALADALLASGVEVVGEVDECDVLLAHDFCDLPNTLPQHAHVF